MEYRVLGKLEVLRDGEPIELGAHLQRSLLAMLLTEPNTVFSTDRLIDGLWAEDGGPDKQSSLWVYVSGLRKALEPDREKRSEGTILLTRSPGYLIEVDRNDVDSLRFEALVAEGRALADRDPDAASLVLGEALALWRGRAFEDFTYNVFAQQEIARLEELRLEAVEARIDADLARGMSRQLVSELETLVRQNPLREWTTGQLMTALYRSGRQADALRAYQHLRDRLSTELGIEPSARLRALEERIVVGDESLEASGGAVLPGAAPGLAVRGYELREKIGEGAFGEAYRAYQPAVGREVAIKVIRPEFANDPEFIRRFEAEAQTVARLEHPHIVPLYDYWREPDAAYLVMRLMTGGNLTSVIEQTALSADQATRVADQLGSALRTAHRSHVVHRDIKPDNILIDAAGNAYLSDFGIAVGKNSDDDGPVAPSTLLPPFAAPEQLTEHTATEQSDVYSLGVVIAQALTGLTGDIEQIRGALPPIAMRVIDRATATESAERYADVGAFVRDLREALLGDGAPTIVDDRELENPYKGLRSFDSGDADDFHGRERLVDRLVARLGERNSRGRFVAVVGPSGSGKSSVVRAGLLPAVRSGAVTQSSSWFAVEMTPAPHPFEALSEALRSIAVDPPLLLLEMILNSENGLGQTLDRILPDDGSQLLLVIDQFEELFTQVNEEIANQFLDAIVAAITSEHSRLRVVVTLRADFYDRPLRHRGLGNLLREGTEVITPMSPEELERAITGPVEPLGVSFEPALVAELVRDVVDRAGALPLLQYALTELFENRAGARITSAAYRELGGVSGALVERAEGLLANLGADANDTVRQVFLRLVTLGEGTEDTRRRVLRRELDDLAVDKSVLEGVIGTYGRHRLLSFDRDPVSRGPTVEISHEALLSEWTRLRRWIDGARHDVRNQRRLAQALEEWRDAEHSDEYLLRGGRLDQLHGWARTTDLPLGQNEQAFLDASVGERERALSEERDREQRAAEAEAEAHHRSRQLTIATVAGFFVAALAAFGIWQWRSADDARQTAEAESVAADAARETAESERESAELARQSAEDARAESQSLVDAAALVTEADQLLPSDPELSLLLAIEAVHATADLGYATEAAVDSVHWALHELGVQFDVDENTETAVRSGPRGLSGVYVYPPAELVAFAERTIDRRLSDDECREHLSGPCPDRLVLDDDLPLRFGEESYTRDVRVGGFYDVVNPVGTLAGTRIRFEAKGLRFQPGFLAELDRFTQATGIEVDVVGAFEDAPFGAELTVDRPDIVVIDSSDLDVQVNALDLERVVDVDRLRTDFSSHLLEAATLERPGSAEPASIRALPMLAVPKGLVFYPRASFEAAGYEVPSTWDELIELSEQILADGRTPWCWGFRGEAVTFDDGPTSLVDASGWPGTDLIESLVLRTAGTETYDDWYQGRVPFSHPDVIEAATLADELLFTSGFTDGGPESISSTYSGDGLFRMLETGFRPGGERRLDCWLSMSGSFGLRELPNNTAIGTDVDFFHLPPRKAGEAPPVVGNTVFAAAVVDRPEVRALMRVMASDQWGSEWARDPESNFVSANRRFNNVAYRIAVSSAPSLQPAADVKIRLSQLVRNAVTADDFRLDASDLMPDAIGMFEGTEPGAFWRGMVDWADGERTIEQVFADIDAEWAALREAEG